MKRKTPFCRCNSRVNYNTYLYINYIKKTGELLQHIYKGFIFYIISYINQYLLISHKTATKPTD